MAEEKSAINIYISPFLIESDLDNPKKFKFSGKVIDRANVDFVSKNGFHL